MTEWLQDHDEVWLHVDRLDTAYLYPTAVWFLARANSIPGTYRRELFSTIQC